MATIGLVPRRLGAIADAITDALVEGIRDGSLPILIGSFCAALILVLWRFLAGAVPDEILPAIGLVFIVGIARVVLPQIIEMIDMTLTAWRRWHQ